MPRPVIERCSAAAYTVPTESPESDGTIEWEATTMVVVEVTAGGVTGLGYSYGAAAAVRVAEEVLFPVLRGGHAHDVGAAVRAMVAAVRNIGRPGVASCALSAADVALWDWKSRALRLSMAELLGRARPAVAAYGSGGFTSYSSRQLADQLGGWATEGYRMVKMKIGRDPDADLDRVRVAREAVGPEVELFVDANGAYSRQQALAAAEAMAGLGVTWFEEPVSSDDLAGLRLLVERVPGGMAVTAGEYGHDLPYFRRMLEAGAVGVLQADATRCGGVTGFLGAGALCQAFGIPLSAHTAPTLHAHLGCVVPATVHVEAFFDHLRLETLLFDGALAPRGGMLEPDLDRPGLGIELRRDVAARFADPAPRLAA